MSLYDVGYKYFYNRILNVGYQLNIIATVSALGIISVILMMSD